MTLLSLRFGVVCQILGVDGAGIDLIAGFGLSVRESVTYFERACVFWTAKY